MIDWIADKGHLRIGNLDREAIPRWYQVSLGWKAAPFIVLMACYSLLTWHVHKKVQPGNSDFIIYYTAARLTSAGEVHSLYDFKIQEKYQRKILREIDSPITFQDGLLPYNHPPFEILWFLPIAGLTYRIAFLVWSLVNLGCFVTGVFVLLRSCKGEGFHRYRETFMGTMAFLPVLVTLLQGQDTAMVFLFLCLAFRDLKNNQDYRAGMWISLCLQRFQFLPTILLLLLCKKRSKALVGFAAGLLSLGLISLALLGISGLAGYMGLIREMVHWIDRYGISPAQMHCLRGQSLALWQHQFPTLATVVTLTATFGLVAILLRAWKGEWDVRDPDFDLKFAFLVLVSVLVSPHVNFHDLSLLILPGVLIDAYLRHNPLVTNVDRWLARLVYWVAFPLMLATRPLSLVLPVKVDVIGLLAVAMILYLKIRQFSDLRREVQSTPLTKPL